MDALTSSTTFVMSGQTSQFVMNPVGGRSGRCASATAEEYQGHHADPACAPLRHLEMGSVFTHTARSAS